MQELTLRQTQQVSGGELIITPQSGFFQRQRLSQGPFVVPNHPAFGIIPYPKPWQPVLQPDSIEPGTIT